MIGRTLSHYEITGKLGAGGMGEVYLARDTTLDRRVALKVLPSEVAADRSLLRRLQREAKALAALDHPNIVTIFSVEEADGIHFLTMAYVDGRTLEELIPPEGMPVERLLELGLALADALRAAHEHGIVHRDLKPSNVMVDGEGRLRVLDFGLARMVETVPLSSQDATRTMKEPVTQRGMMLGTIPYMSPEQAEGKPVGPPSDLFSLGVVLYEMATGRRPFEGETTASLISSILRDTPSAVTVFRSELPESLDRVVRRCLEKVPEERYPSAQALRDELEGLHRDVLSGTVTGAARRPRPWVGMLAAVVVAVSLAAVVGTMTWRGRERAPKESEASVVEPATPLKGSIAVLPFENTLNDEESDYLCDGVTESLIRQISSIPSVRVTPLSAVLNFKGQSVDPGEVGSQLGVESVLTGTLSRQGARLWITAELVEARSGVQLWSHTYDRTAAELLDVQEEIAGAILDDGLRIELSSDEERDFVQVPTTDGEAYDLFLQAAHIQRRATEDDYLEARELLRRATVRDPEFALAWVMLAGTHAMMAFDGLERPTDAWPQASRYMRQALKLEPDLAAAHALTHAQAFAFDWDWEGAERERRLVLQSPVGTIDSSWFRAFAFERWALGRPDEALELARRTRELDPLSIYLLTLEADFLVQDGQLDAAVEAYERAIRIDPSDFNPYFGLADALFQQGRFDAACEMRRQAHSVAGDDSLEELFAAAQGEQGYRQADQAAVRLQLLWLETRSAWGYASPLDFARAYAQLDEKEEAFRYLEQAFVDRSPGLVFLNSDRVWDSIRDDPRFLVAVRRVGLPSTN